jgi:hypothetical protein
MKFQPLLSNSRLAALAGCNVILFCSALAVAQLPTLPQPPTSGDPIIAPSGAPALRAARINMVLTGDSTVTDQTGWGKGFANCLAPDVQLTNLSRGGRSSKSFIAEGSWKKALDLKPDYVLIQFGHNDQAGHGPDRETDPETTYRQYMNQYVDDARAAGIKPVLITSLSRRQWGDDGKIHSTLEPNVKVVKEIAAKNTFRSLICTDDLSNCMKNSARRAATNCRRKNLMAVSTIRI